MDMLQTKSKSGKVFYIPYDNDNKVIIPIYKYLKHLTMNNSSKNTIRNNCRYLLHFWSYLEEHDCDYINFVSKEGQSSKRAYENLAEYRLQLVYPNIHDQVVPIEGIKPIRKDSTANQMLSSVISFYSFLDETGLVNDLPVFTEKKALSHSNSFLREMCLKKKLGKKSLLLSKTTQEEPVYITEEEFELCWNACTSRRNRIILGLMFYGGLRVSEVVGLNIVDMRDIYKNIIYVTERRDENNIDAACKYHSSGSVVIDDRLRDEIITYMNHDLFGIDTNYLIVNFKEPNLYGSMKTDTIRDMISSLMIKVGLDKLHPHMFRHGCAMRMVFADMDILSISTKLRHRSISSTQIYTKMNINAKIQAQEKLSKKLEADFAPLEIDFTRLAESLKEDDDE